MKISHSGYAGAFAATLLLGAALSPAHAGTLDTVKERGTLNCGVNEGLLGFAAKDAEGKWSGFDVDFCRAVAAATLGDAEKVTYVPLSVGDRFNALAESKVDLLVRNSTWTVSREADYDITFVGVTYYDGQGFMVPRSGDVVSSLELGGSKVCVQKDTTTEANLTDYFTANNMPFEPVLTASTAESLAAYKEGRCNVLTSDISQLYASRLDLEDRDEHLILADTISKEPLGPAVRQDDPDWVRVVKWVHFALLNAEELGVNSQTIGEAKSSEKPDVRRLLGLEGKIGEELGVSANWAETMIAAVGNYGEIFERNLGGDSKLGIPRGLNQLWNLGGVQYAPPMR